MAGAIISTMPPRKRLFATALVFLFLGLLIFGWNNGDPGTGPKPPEAENGILDLGNWDLETDGTVNLDGQWEFYWQQLLEPADFMIDPPRQDAYINVPSTWNRFRVDGEEIGGKGFATYRLRVLFHDQNRLLALKIPRVFTAYKLWINGDLVASAGEVGTGLQGMTPQYLPQVAIFNPGEDPIEIVVQVSNYYHRSGGLLEGINFGLEKHILDTRTRALGLELFIVGCLFLMGMYHLGLFAYRTNELSSLVFGVYCLAIGIRTTLAGEIFFIYLMPNFNWEVAHNLQTLAFYLGLPLFIMFIHLIFPQDVPLKAVRIVQYITLPFALLVALTPARIFTIVNPAFQIFVFMAIPYFIYTLIKAVRNRRQGSLIILIGAIILIAATVNDIVFLSVILNDYPVPLLRKFITSGNLSSRGLLVFTFAQSLVLAMKFSTAFTRVEHMSQEMRELNMNLEEKVQERTAELETSNEELERAYTELSKLQKYRRDLLANISHDLRSPLTTIKGYVDTILDGVVKDPQEQHQYLQVVRDKTVGLDSLTRELSELASLESREVELNCANLTPGEIVEAIYQRNYLHLQAQGLELRIAPAYSAQKISADPEKIERVFDNLIANSIRHTPVDGTITIGFTDQQRETVFYVRDNGTGIDKEDLPKIFDRFYKAGKTRKACSGGSGLGLAIAKEIVEFHGGRIWAENNPDAGVTFFLSLPHVNN